MFYTDVLLSKKGPLAKIWLAAHMERKLSKTQFLQANLPASIDTIIQTGEEPMALRLSGQLLLGVTRIYSRKARYLLEDCNEAFVKIRLAFKPGMVDMAGDHAVANVNAITLNDAMTDYGMLLPEPSFDLNMFMQPNAQTGTSQSMSRTQDITLAEPSQTSFRAAHEELQDMFGIDLSTSHVDPNAADDGWNLDLGFGEPERPAGATMPSISDASMPMSSSNFDESLEVERGRDAVAERPFSPRRDSISLDQSYTKDPSAMDIPEPSFDLAAAGDLLGGGGPMQMDLDTALLDDQLPFPDVELPEVHQSAAGATDDVTNSLQIETIAPVDLNEEQDENAIAKSKKAQAKKRKLIIDSQTEIPSELIQQQLRDTSDILGVERYVPNSRKMQQLLDIRKQGASYFIARATFDYMPAELHMLFRNKWRDFTAPEFSADAESPAKKRRALKDVSEKENVAGLLNAFNDQNQEEYQFGNLDLPDISAAPMDPTLSLGGGGMDSSTIATGNTFPSAALQPEEEEIEGEPSNKRRKTAPSSPSASTTFLPDDLTNTLTSLVDESLIAPDEDDTANNPQGFSRSTVATVRDIQSRVPRNEAGTTTLSYNAITAGAGRTEAARLFFELLVLGTRDMVGVRQERAYGDVEVRAKEALWGAV